MSDEVLPFVDAPVLWLPLSSAPPLREQIHHGLRSRRACFGRLFFIFFERMVSMVSMFVDASVTHDDNTFVHSRVNLHRLLRASTRPILLHGFIGRDAGRFPRCHCRRFAQKSVWNPPCGRVGCPNKAPEHRAPNVSLRQQPLDLPIGVRIGVRQ